MLGRSRRRHCVIASTSQLAFDVKKKLEWVLYKNGLEANQNAFPSKKEPRVRLVYSNQCDLNESV